MTLSATNGGGTGNATLTLTITVGAPVITSATTASGTVGSAFSYQITATNTPTSYGATGLPAGLVGEHRDGVDFGNADGGRNIDGDAERDQQRWHRQRHSDADHRSGAAGDHERDDGERDGGKRLLVSDHGDEFADQLRSDRIAGGLVGEHHDGIDLGDTHCGWNIDGDAECDQQRRARETPL